MPQFGFFELMLVAVVILIVVGPKDLPKLMRDAGRLVAKARSMAGEFTAAFDQMAREADMEELRKEIDELKKHNPITDAKRAIDETISPIDQEMRKEASEIDKAVSDTVGDRVSSEKTTSDAKSENADHKAEPKEEIAKP